MGKDVFENDFLFKVCVIRHKGTIYWLEENTKEGRILVVIIDKLE